jgi:hypothetical protein
MLALESGAALKAATKCGAQKEVLAAAKTRAAADVGNANGHKLHALNDAGGQAVVLAGANTLAAPDAGNANGHKLHAFNDAGAQKVVLAGANTLAAPDAGKLNGHTMHAFNDAGAQKVVLAGAEAIPSVDLGHANAYKLRAVNNAGGQKSVLAAAHTMDPEALGAAATGATYGQVNKAGGQALVLGGIKKQSTAQLAAGTAAKRHFGVMAGGVDEMKKVYMQMPKSELSQAFVKDWKAAKKCNLAPLLFQTGMQAPHKELLEHYPSAKLQIFIQSDPASAALKEGEAVEGRRSGQDKWFGAKVGKVNNYKSFDLTYDDGDKEKRVCQLRIRRKVDTGKSVLRYLEALLLLQAHANSDEAVQRAFNKLDMETLVLFAHSHILCIRLAVGQTWYPNGRGGGYREENQPMLARVLAQVVSTHARGGFTWHEAVTAVVEHEQPLTNIAKKNKRKRQDSEEQGGEGGKKKDGKGGDKKKAAKRGAKRGGSMRKKRQGR